jgi:sulfate/thiosulfate transport system permease protein
MSSASHAIRTHAARTRLIRMGLIGLVFAYVGLLLIAPLAGIVWTAFSSGFDVVRETFARADVKHAFWLTSVITLITVTMTTVFGVLTAWVLTRDEFPGKRLLNGLVDLPLAVSPVTVGLMAVLLFGTGGWFAEFFAARGIQIIFALPSMILVTIFICIPFVIREVGPVLEEVGTNEEEAALTLGASHLQKFFRVTLPNIKWGLLYGIALSTARAMGEIGAVLIVSGQIQGQTETATLYIFRAFEERQDASGTVVAITLAVVSIVLLIGIETFKHRQSKEARS